jgi:hypothetical protein
MGKLPIKSQFALGIFAPYVDESTILIKSFESKKYFKYSGLISSLALKMSASVIAIPSLSAKSTFAKRALIFRIAHRF